jgi:hypothetical protein
MVGVAVMAYIPKSAMRRIENYQRLKPQPVVTDPKPYQPGQLTPAQFAYLFWRVMDEKYVQKRAAVKTWAEWEAFLAVRNTRPATTEPDEDAPPKKSGYGRAITANTLD